MKTKITELLGIKYPVIQGGMAWTSDANLAAAVSNAGGAGIIATGGRTTEWTKAEIQKCKTLTDKPFGVNLMLMAPNVNEIIEVVCEERVAFVTLGAGNPVPHIEKLHSAGIKVIPVVPNVKLAKRVEAAGVDAMVIEGMEGGGHIGQQTTMALMTNVLPLVKNVPVLVAGGIADGRGIAAALLMGADGVQMGSRFILTTECPTHPRAKQAIIDATDTDSAVTGFSRTHPRAKQAIIDATDTDSAVTGFSRNNAVRCLKNEFTKEYLAKEVAGAPQQELNDFATGTNRMGAVDGDIEHGAVLVGQSLNALNEILPCKEVMEKLIAEARETLANAKNIEL